VQPDIKHPRSNPDLQMVLDKASSHKSKDIKIPSNISFVRLPPYSQELNPVEYTQA
jgi:transposase